MTSFMMKRKMRIVGLLDKLDLRGAKYTESEEN
jgi:hypothetical protein